MSSDADVEPGQTSTVRALSRAFQVLRALALEQERGMRLIDVVRHTQLSRPTVHRILQALIDESAVEQDAATRRYRVGAEISLLALARPSRVPLRKIAEPYLQYLSDQLGDTVFLTIQSGRDSVCLDRRLGSFPVKVMSIDIGTRRPLGVGVAGVMLMAALPEAEVEHLLNLNAARLAAIDQEVEVIKQRIEQAQRLGYAYVANGVTKGTSALSVPIWGPEGDIIAALSVTAISGNLLPEDAPRIAQALQEQAATITRRLAQASG